MTEEEILKCLTDQIKKARANTQQGLLSLARGIREAAAELQKTLEGEWAKEEKPLKELTQRYEVEREKGREKYEAKLRILQFKIDEALALGGKHIPIAEKLKQEVAETETRQAEEQKRIDLVYNRLYVIAHNRANIASRIYGDLKEDIEEATTSITRTFVIEFLDDILAFLQELAADGANFNILLKSALISRSWTGEGRDLAARIDFWFT